MKIGLDFGISYTKIACLMDFPSDKNRKTSAFRLSCFPTRLAKFNHKFSIGHEAEALQRQHSLLPNQDFFFQFKYDLSHIHQHIHEAEGDQHEQAKQLKSTLQNYLEQVLTKVESENGSIHSIGLAVPGWWPHQPLDEKHFTGRNLLIDSLTGERIYSLEGVYPESICTAAFHYCTREMEVKAPYKLMICDAGGGTLDLSILELGPRGVETLLKSNPIVEGESIGGYDFDTACITDHWAREGKKLPAFDQELVLNPDFVSDLIRFEAHKIGTKGLIASIDDSDFANDPDLKESPLFDRNFPIRISSASTAFQQVRARIEAVLQKFHERCLDKNLKPDFGILLGGLAHFEPVKKIIVQSLHELFALSDEQLEVYSEDESRFAIARGVCYIMNGAFPLTIEPSEFELGFYANQLIHGRKQQISCPLINFDEELASMRDRYRDDIVCEMDENWQAPPDLYLINRGNGTHTPKPGTTSTLPAGQYVMGVRISSRGQPEILCKSLGKGGPVVSYPLDEDLLFKE